jgi:hypothetical protein
MKHITFVAIFLFAAQAVSEQRSSQMDATGIAEPSLAVVQSSAVGVCASCGVVLRTLADISNDTTAVSVPR